MKKLIVLILISNFTTANYAQLNKILFNEFMQFIEAQKTSEFEQSKTDAMLYLRALNMSNFEGANNSKKKKIEMQALDSLITYNNNGDPYKITESFSYDKSGNQLSNKTTNFYSDSTTTSTTIYFKYKNNRIINFNYKTDEINIGKSNYKGEYFYSKYKLKESRLLMLDTLENEWEINQKVYYDYNKNDEIEHINYFEVDSIGNEKVGRTIAYTYQKNKIIIDELIPEASFSRDYEIQKIYLFNSNNEIVEKQINYITMPRYNNKEILIYDEWGKITARKMYEYESTEEKWNIFQEYFYTYNKMNKIVKLSQFRYDFFYGDTAIHQTSLIYDENGFVRTRTLQTFDKLTNLFENESKYTYNYDNSGNLLETLRFYWSSFDNKWINNSKHTNTFNASFNVQEEVLLPKFSSYDPYGNISISTLLRAIFPVPDYDFHGNILLAGRYWHMQTGSSQLQYNNIEEVWDEYQSKTFHYSTHKVKQNSTAQAVIIVFPNPAVNYFTIKIPALPANTKIKIYNLSGLKVMEQPVFKDELIYINHLQSGLYYFQLFVDGDKIERTGKLMIR